MTFLLFLYLLSAIKTIFTNCIPYFIIQSNSYPCYYIVNTDLSNAITWTKKTELITVNWKNVFELQALRWRSKIVVGIRIKDKYKQQQQHVPDNWITTTSSLVEFWKNNICFVYACILFSGTYFSEWKRNSSCKYLFHLFLHTKQQIIEN